LALKPTNQIIHFKERVSAFDRSLQHQIYQHIELNRQKLNYKKQQLNYLWQSKHHQRRHAFHQTRLIQELQQLMSDRLSLYRQRLTHLSDLLKALDPQRVLEKGYSILFAENSSFVINSVRKLNKGQQAKLLLSDGEVFITINEITRCERESHSGSRINTP
jgi:exodeoxyribonuclease VII large subunit